MVTWKVILIKLTFCLIIVGILAFLFYLWVKWMDDNDHWGGGDDMSNDQNFHDYGGGFYGGFD